MYELGIKLENAVHFLNKVVTVSSEFEHAAAAENTVKLKDEKRLKLTSDSKCWGGGG